MRQTNIRSVITAMAIVLGSATIARAQSDSSTEVLTLNPDDSWEGARSVGSSWGNSSKHKLIVVTVDQPQGRQACRVQSFTKDKLVCSRAFGGTRTFLPEQVVALILPGDGHLKLWLLLGFNGGIGAAIWGTVVLAATCPACAVGSGVLALMLFSGAGAILIGDDQPDRLLYVAPGQRLSHRLGQIEE